MAEQAKAAVLTDPRQFEYREVEIPEIGPDEGILRVEAAGLCGTDWEQYLGHLDNTPWAVRPIIPGHEILGWVEKVGENLYVVGVSFPSGQEGLSDLKRSLLSENS